MRRKDHADDGAEGGMGAGGIEELHNRKTLDRGLPPAHVVAFLEHFFALTA